ncbi:MAG: hypothetical protein JWP09_428 [Candidatus Taylorbacteria bacterium]|nr:hypothetical protein [Candidatus Taylorbacteria bacterium]
MNPEILDPELSKTEISDLIHQGINDEIIRRKREVTALNFSEFLPLFDAMSKVDELKYMLDNTPYDNPETNYKRQQLEVEYKEALRMVRQEIDKVDATSKNARFLMYIDQIDAVKDVYDKHIRPQADTVIIKN